SMVWGEDMAAPARLAWSPRASCAATPPGAGTRRFSPPPWRPVALAGYGRRGAAAGMVVVWSRPPMSRSAAAGHPDYRGTGSAAASSASRSRNRTRRGSANRPRNTATSAPATYQRVALKVRAKLWALASRPARASSACSSRCCAAGSAGAAGLAWQLAGTWVGSVVADRSCTQDRKPVRIVAWLGAGIATAGSWPGKGGGATGAARAGAGGQEDEEDHADQRVAQRHTGRRGGAEPPRAGPGVADRDAGEDEAPQRRGHQAEAEARHGQRHQHLPGVDARPVVRAQPRVAGEPGGVHQRPGHQRRAPEPGGEHPHRQARPGG